MGQQPAPGKHFNQKKKPKSAYLRTELLQKSNDAASNLKKSSAPVIPVRSRGMPRKMTDTTPLKGIPSRVPSSGFRSGALTSPTVGGRPLPRTPAGRKDGGIKLLDIAEQPLGYAAAKKRKRMQDLEEAKKTAELVVPPNAGPTNAGPTPDYAAGLSTTPTYTPTTTPSRETPVTTTVTTTSIITPPTTASVVVTTPPVPYVPPVVTSTKATPTPVLITTSSALQTLSEASAAITPSPKTTEVILKSTTVPATTITPPQSVLVTRPIQQITQIRLQPQPVGNTLQKKGLALTREQMLEAQDMFRTANKVTRPEKALILGFMAGSRDNPCPHLGNIVTIKLSEDQENVQQADDTYLTMMVETHFQMNYNNGEWKRIKKFRTIENAEHVTVQSAPPSSAAALL